jgi:hypothetical protein
MSSIDPSQVVVSYRGIASLLENMELSHATEAGVVPRTEAGEEPLVARGADDPMALLPAAPQQPAPPAATEMPELDDLQRMAMLRQLTTAIGDIAKEDKTPGVFFVPENQAASLLLAFMAREGVDKQRLEETKGGAFEVKFDDKDLAGWIGSFFHDWIKRLKKHPFIGAAPIPEAIGNQARIALLGDWGTGLYGAPVCAKSIEKATPAFDTIIHLGDIYYAGNSDEVDARFLKPWPKVPGARNRAVNANHEMYSGGEGYYGKVLPAFQQPSSLFSLQNDHFLLIGLDTGWDEHDLAGNQVGWVTALAAQAGNRKIVLFSHHQPFSVFEAQGTNLIKKLRPLLASRRIFAWYWGHEHRCMVYEKHQEWQMYGRLIGHSGYPYFRKDFSAYPIQQVNQDQTSWRVLAQTDVAPRSAILEGPNPYVLDAPQKYGPHGWASLVLDGPSLLERIHAADGTVLHEKVLA